MKAVCASVDTAHDTDRRIQKGMTQHRVAKIDLTSKELDLNQHVIEFGQTESRTLATMLGLTDCQEAVLDKRLDSNAVPKLKIFLSVYRGVASLDSKQAEGKMQITAGRSDSTDIEADELECRRLWASNIGLG